jgi:hypothetical protein
MNDTHAYVVILASVHLVPLELDRATAETLGTDWKRRVEQGVYLAYAADGATYPVLLRLTEIVAVSPEKFALPDVQGTTMTTATLLRGVRGSPADRTATDFDGDVYLKGKIAMTGAPDLSEREAAEQLATLVINKIGEHMRRRRDDGDEPVPTGA